MRRIAFFILLSAAVMVAGCGGKKHDPAYYEAKIDSLRKAEQMKQLRKIKQEAGIYDDPVEQFFDTLHVRPLPIQSAGANIGRLAHFSTLPKSLVSRFGYPLDVPLRMVPLPRWHNYRVVMLAEGPDSIAPLLSLVTLDASYQPIDQLVIYEQKAEERGDDMVMKFNDYYITSDYEITLMFAFLRKDSNNPILESTRRYVINGDGYFDEVVVDF